MLSDRPVSTPAISADGTIIANLVSGVVQALQPSFAPLPSTTATPGFPSGSHHRSIKRVVGIVIGIALVFTIVVGGFMAWYLISRRRKRLGDSAQSDPPGGEYYGLGPDADSSGLQVPAEPLSAGANSYYGSVQ